MRQRRLRHEAPAAPDRAERVRAPSAGAKGDGVDLPRRADQGAADMASPTGWA